MKVVVGFIPLLDCASLVVAAERGFAAYLIPAARFAGRRASRVARIPPEASLSLSTPTPDVVYPVHVSFLFLLIHHVIDYA